MLRKTSEIVSSVVTLLFSSMYVCKTLKTLKTKTAEKYDAKTANHKKEEKGKIGVPIGSKSLVMNFETLNFVHKIKLYSYYLGLGVMQVIPVREIGFDRDRNKLSWNQEYKAPTPTYNQN